MQIVYRCMYVPPEGGESLLLDTDVAVQGVDEYSLRLEELLHVDESRVQLAVAGRQYGQEAQREDDRRAPGEQPTPLGRHRGEVWVGGCARTN